MHILIIIYSGIAKEILDLHMATPINLRLILNIFILEEILYD